MDSNTATITKRTGYEQEIKDIKAWEVVDGVSKMGRIEFTTFSGRIITYFLKDILYMNLPE